jgi:hypothetical protein
LGQPHIAYHDPSAPSPQQLHPDTALFLRFLNIPSKTRFLHRAYWPFCTFAYAVNRRSAEIIVRQMDKEPEGGVSAYDVALLTACRDRGWKCWSVAPELFHHRQGVSEISVADLQDFNIEGGSSSGGAQRSVSLRGTWTLGCGARHGQLWVGDEDVEGRREVKRAVQRVLERGRVSVRLRAWKRRRCGRGGGGVSGENVARRLDRGLMTPDIFL